MELSAKISPLVLGPVCQAKLLSAKIGIHTQVQSCGKCSFCGPVIIKQLKKHLYKKQKEKVLWPSKESKGSQEG